MKYLIAEASDTFVGVSTESAKLGRKLGVEFPEDPVAYNLKGIDIPTYRMVAEKFTKSNH